MRVSSGFALPALGVVALAAALWITGTRSEAADAVAAKGPIVFCIEGFQVVNLANDKKSYQCRSATLKCGQGYAQLSMAGIVGNRAQYTCSVPAG